MCQDWEVVRGLGGVGHYHVYHHLDGRRRSFTCLKELLLYVSQGDLFFLHQQMHSYYSSHSTDLVGRSLYYDLSQLCLHFDDERMSIFWQDQGSWVVHSWTLFERSSVHVVQLVTGRHIYMFAGLKYPMRAPLLEKLLSKGLHVPPSHCSNRKLASLVIHSVKAALGYARYRSLSSSTV